MVRGVAGGKGVRFSRPMVTTGFRDIASQLATQELGPRTRREQREAFAQQATAMTATDLDRRLVSAASDGVVDVVTARAAGGEDAKHLATRLHHLTSMGLATKEAPTRYRLDPDLLHTLGQMAERTRAASDARRVLGASAGRVSYLLRSAPDKSLTGHVLATGLAAGGQRGFIAVRAETGTVWAEFDPRFPPRVAAGGVVQLYPHGGTDKTPGGLTPVNRAVGDDAPARLGIKVITNARPEAKLSQPVWTAVDRWVGRGETPPWPGGAAHLAARTDTLRDLKMIRDDGSGGGAVVASGGSKVRRITCAPRSCGPTPSRSPRPPGGASNCPRVRCRFGVRWSPCGTRIRARCWGSRAVSACTSCWSVPGACPAEGDVVEVRRSADDRVARVDAVGGRDSGAGVEA